MLEEIKNGAGDASYTVAVKLVTTVKIHTDAARLLPFPGCARFSLDGNEVLSTEVTSADFAKEVGKLSILMPSVKEVGAMLSDAIALGLTVARDVDEGAFDAAALRRLVDDGKGDCVVISGDLSQEALAALDAAGVAAVGAGFLTSKNIVN